MDGAECSTGAHANGNCGAAAEDAQPWCALAPPWCKAVRRRFSAGLPTPPFPQPSPWLSMTTSHWHA